MWDRILEQIAEYACFSSPTTDGLPLCAYIGFEGRQWKRRNITEFKQGDVTLEWVNSTQGNSTAWDLCKLRNVCLKCGALTLWVSLF